MILTVWRRMAGLISRMVEMRIVLVDLELRGWHRDQAMLCMVEEAGDC